MSVGRILTLGLGSFGGVNFLPTLGYGSGEDVPPIVPPPQPGGGGGGGDPRRRADFGWRGNRLRDDEEPEKRSPVDEVARKTAEAILEKARQIASEKAALEALRLSKMRAKRAAERAAKVSAMEAKVAQLEVEMSILQDDEEVLQIIKYML